MSGRTRSGDGWENSRRNSELEAAIVAGSIFSGRSGDGWNSDVEFRTSLFLVLELLGPSFSGILPWDHSFAKFDCVAFFFPGAGVVGNPSYLLLDWLCWILFCLAYSLGTWFLLFRHESRTFQRETDSHLASQLVLHYLTVMPAVGFFLEKKGRRAALLEKTEPGLLCCPSSEPTIHGRALAEKCSTGWSRRLHIPWSVDSAWHGSHLTHRLSRRLIRSKASPPDSRAWLDLLLHSVSSLSSHTVSWTSLSWLEWSLWSLPPSGPDYPCRWIPWRESAATCDNPKVSRQKMIAWPADLRCFSDSAPKPTPIKWYLSLALCSTHQYHLASRDHIPWANTMEKLRA